jgi:hypothetical protein
VQRAVKQARRKLGLCILPHELRHGYATHCLERGTNPHAIQQVMGRKSLETAMGYLHAESLSVRSPLEALLVKCTTTDQVLAQLPAVEDSVPGQAHGPRVQRPTSPLPREAGRGWRQVGRGRCTGRLW